ncbi:hypothetical protein [Nocardia grenadensis]|uniref:hypothetical protein n=1 Tax=Nocardia grenadensis TaxID=931537 RepID=UPI003D936C8D
MVEGEFQAEAAVYLLFFAWFCCAEYRGQAAEGVDESFYFFLVQLSLGDLRRFERRQLGGDEFSLVLDFLDPGRNHSRVGSGFQRGAVSAEFLVEFSECVLCGVRGRGGVGLDLFEHGE